MAFFSAVPGSPVFLGSSWFNKLSCASPSALEALQHDSPHGGDKDTEEQRKIEDDPGVGPSPCQTILASFETYADSHAIVELPEYHENGTPHRARTFYRSSRSMDSYAFLRSYEAQVQCYSTLPPELLPSANHVHGRLREAEVALLLSFV